MKKRKIAVSDKDAIIESLVRKTAHKALAVWACECAERALPYFENSYPNDARPRCAIEAGRAWVKTGVFKMVDVRKRALEAHAAAREVQDDDAARSAARAAGHAVATAHVPTHAIAAALYAVTAFRDAVAPASGEGEVDKERAWQLQRLRSFSEVKQ